MIRRQLDAIQEPLLDRRAVEAVFGIANTDAQRIMRRAGAWKLGKQLVVYRFRLLAWLNEIESGRDFREEEARRESLEVQFERFRREIRGRRVRILPMPEVDTIAGLPGGIKLGKGRLEIEFFGTEDLLKHLWVLSQAVAKDFLRFQQLVE